MQSLGEILRRNRTVIVLFTILVIVHSVFLGFLGIRAIRSDEAERQFQERNRQRQIVQLLEADLETWHFSHAPGAAAAQALLRFTADGDRIVLPDFEGGA